MEVATFGFALAWGLSQDRGRTLFMAAPEHVFVESGAPYAEGLAQFGLDLDRLLIARTQSQADALWACEQALTLPGALAFCVVAPARKALSLLATRRLLLAAEKHDSRCALIRFDDAKASAAWLRWSVSAASSQGAKWELGPPVFDIRLTRNRAGPSGQSWRVEWNGREHVFLDVGQIERAMDVDLVAPPGDRAADEPLRRRA